MAVLVDYALTTVADVKESLGLASSDTTKDNLIIRKINAATDAIQKYTGRNFKLQSYVEYKDGSNTDAIVLQQRPIVNDDSHPFSVERRDTSLNEDDFETVDSDLAFIDNEAGVVELNYTALGHWSRYKYSYWAGYTAVPSDLAEAANALACYYVNNPAGANIGLSQRKEGQREVRYSSGSAGGLPITFASIIQQLGVDDIINAYSNQPLLTSN